ncbi:DUF1552 domain-containing protein [Candidatus Palauibacter soopunensis]|uniref:DUF1552 domain-containing protein n=1 Tax=Candidatus Palauibacter soopunensis TaxID=3056739 RepID=UPI0023955F89|nr:DUF1552 domain-containing protein [Candidatus Palauibacter soopunensis]MDE2877375.1 DUF1552 domain-containing protein [Candidatus Palauibacter soopunensis]
MEFITGKHLSRRTFLRGAGATVALPFLDAMVPAGRLWAREVADPTRLVCIEMVHGSAGSSGFGAAQNYWSPAATGRGFDLSPTALSSLEPYRDYLTIISDTDVEPAEATKPKEIGGDHFRSSATFLTQAHPKQTESSDVFVGPSLDQLYAHRFGQDTPIPSMQLCIENVDQAGGCAYGYACVYTDTISWSSPTQPLPMIRDPRVAFDQLFGAGGTPEARAARQRSSASILDFLTGEVASLRGRLDPSDRQRMDRYLENVREIERRIQRVVARNESGEDRDLPEAPAGVPDSFDEHVKLMFDLQALAFQADMTRVFSFKMGRDASGRVYPESGIDRGFHPASHHGDNENNITDFAQINRYHVGLVPYFLDRLKESMEGDTHLLDKTMIIYGSPMGDPNVHNHKRCPLFVVGGAQGRMEGNQHLRAAPGTPMANVMLSLMHRLGMDDVTSFGNSTGTFSFAETAD